MPQFKGLLFSMVAAYAATSASTAMSQMPPPFEGTGQNPSLPPIIHRGPQIPPHLDLRKPVKIVTGRYVGAGNFQILNNDFSASFVAQKEYPPERVTPDSFYENEFFVVDPASGKPLAGIPVEVVCVSGACPVIPPLPPLCEMGGGHCLPAQDRTHYVSDETGMFRVNLLLGTAGQRVVTGLQASGDKFKSPIVELVFDATTVPTKGMVCVVNLSGIAGNYADQFASILYETLEQSGFPLLGKNITSGQPNQAPVNPNVTLSAAKSATSNLQGQLATLSNKLNKLDAAVSISTAALTLNPGVIWAASVNYFATNTNSYGSYKARVTINGPGEDTGWAYLESWNTDCKIYNPGDVVAIYAQYNSSGSSFHEIGHFPIKVLRGYVHIVETHGTVSSPRLFQR